MQWRQSLRRSLLSIPISAVRTDPQRLRERPTQRRNKYLPRVTRSSRESRRLSTSQSPCEIGVATMKRSGFKGLVAAGLVAASVASSTSVVSASDMFLKIGNIKGESTDDK